uniref:Serine/threonine kinase n=1 Tax=Clandestinovirus TaxID=2831644 RepID=A0A8F8PQY9_9VIRU|nr:serine/threonine kinase [Clandestinovirus]
MKRRLQVPVELEDNSKGKLVFEDDIGDSESSSGSLLWSASLLFEPTDSEPKPLAEPVVVKIVSSVSGEDGHRSGVDCEVNFIRKFGSMESLEKNMVALWGWTNCKLKDLKQHMPYVLTDLPDDHGVYEADEYALLVVEKAETHAYAYIKSWCSMLVKKTITVQQFDSAIKPIIFQVLYALNIIKKDDPTFVHNDLHLSNVLLKKRSELQVFVHDGKEFIVQKAVPHALIWDFGYSSSETMKNWDTTQINQMWGLKTTASACPYDVHLFLNSVYLLLETSDECLNTQTASWVRSVIPGILRGKMNDNIYQGRLSSVCQKTTVWQCIPSIDKMLSSWYFASLRKEDSNRDE